jgi:hypothetical protein
LPENNSRFKKTKNEMNQTLVLKENKISFVKQIRGFVDLGFMKTCHEHVTNYSIVWSISQLSKRQLISKANFLVLI